MELAEKIGLGLKELEDYDFKKRHSDKVYYEVFYDIKPIQDINEMSIHTYRQSKNYKFLITFYDYYGRTLKSKEMIYPIDMSVHEILANISDFIKDKGLEIR